MMKSSIVRARSAISMILAAAILAAPIALTSGCEKKSEPEKKAESKPAEPKEGGH